MLLPYGYISQILVGDMDYANVSARGASRQALLDLDVGYRITLDVKDAPEYRCIFYISYYPLVRSSRPENNLLWSFNFIFLSRLRSGSRTTG